MSWTDPDTAIAQQVDRELKALPQPEAPSTLVSGVMRAVALAATRETPWYSRAWLAWPRTAQAASLALVALVGIAFWREGPSVWAWATSAASAAAPMPAWLTGLSDQIGRVMAVARLPWHVLQPVVSYFALLALAASLTLAAFWHAFTKLNTEGVSLR